MLSDSYKYSHPPQYPENMVSMYAYGEARSSKVYSELVVAGLQGILHKYFTKPFTIVDINQASAFSALHGIPFDEEGWVHILQEHDGHLPIRICAIPEGTVVPTNVPLFTIESTDSRVPWVVGFVETLLMKVWYPTNIATRAYHVRKILQKYGSPEWAQFAYHNFGDRGSSSVESAAIGGYAHLTQFSGTDNFNSLDYCFRYYESSMAGYSVWASEHSTTTSHGRDGEEEFVYQQLLKNPDAPIMSFVADSYDVYEFTHFCTDPNGRIRKLLESRPHQKLILRPDSGEPVEVITKMLEIMRNNKIEILPKDQNIQKITFKQFGILWGDGIDPATIHRILYEVTKLGFAAENFVFGSGGDLMQNHSRDTLGFAIKCSSITIVNDIPDGSIDITYPQFTEIDVFKDPITDPGKTSKKGKVTTAINRNGAYRVVDLSEAEDPNSEYRNVLVPVFENGKLLVHDSLDTIRARSR